MLRPCPECGYRSDIERNDVCPECGEKLPPKEWAVIWTEVSPWMWHGPMAVMVIGIAWVAAAYFLRTRGVSIGYPPAAPFFFAAPMAIARLFGARFTNVWQIREADLLHRMPVGKEQVYRRLDGWRVSELTKSLTRKNHSLLLFRKITPGDRDRYELQIDDRVNDAAAIFASAQRAFASPAGESPNETPNETPAPRVRSG
ncbi:MAG: hypothetical protein JNL80_15465 [Phycisphaerae bacterium]|nr:hypothetical protein [Phycisphaerae bacterium]